MDDNNSNNDEAARIEVFRSRMRDRVLDAISLLEAKDEESVEHVAAVLKANYETRSEYIELIMTLTGMTLSLLKQVSARSGIPEQMILDTVRERSIFAWSEDE